MGKTITISEETYDIIQDFCHAIATQDSRSTRIPYVYAIRDTKRIYGIDPDYTNDGYVWMDDSGDVSMIQSDELFIEHLIDADYIDSEEDIDLDVDDTIYGYGKVFYLDVRQIKNIFLTEEGAQDHIHAYNYQYDDPDIKVIHLSGNNEIMGLITTLNEIK